MIRIALLLALSLTSYTPAIIVGSGVGMQSVGIAAEKETQEDLVEVAEREPLQGPNQPVEAVVRDYFKGTPLLVKVAQCESNFRHTGKDGEVLRGKANRYDVGIMQINERFHLARANRLGLDIYTLDGNLEYAKYLYKKEGAKPWKASSKCWTGIGRT